MRTEDGVMVIPKFSPFCFYIRRLISHKKWRKLQEFNEREGISIISSDCTGGVVCNYLGMKFNSPFVNLYLSADDFIRVANNLKEYMSFDVELIEMNPYPICRLHDVVLYCVHYNDFDSFRQKWIERRARINYEQVFIIMNDRNGFRQEHYDSFARIPYPKILFSAKKVALPDVKYLPEFKDRPYVGTLSNFSNVFGRKYFMSVNFGGVLSEQFRIK